MSEIAFGGRHISNLEFFRKYGYIPALGAVAAAVALDNSTWLIDRRRRSNVATIEAHDNPGEQALYILPGCRMDGQHMATMFEPQFSQFGSTNYLAYPQRGFSIDSIRSNLLEARSKNLDKPATIYANSMGGIVLSKLLTEEDFRDNFGEIDKLILDSSPTSEQDIRRPVRMAMGAAALLKSSWTASRLTGQMLHMRDLRFKEHEPFISHDQLMAYRQVTSATPLHVTHSQSEFIRKTKLEPGSLAGVASSIYYVQSGHDEVIDTERARKNYEAIFETDIEKIVDSTRPYGSHAAGPEFQGKIIELIAQKETADTTLA